jgi:Zn-dependent peptidase ImmA (M78 family)
VFARGFKTWCETIALQHRRTLKLQPVDPLRPEAVASSLGVPVYGIEEIPGLDPQVLRTLLHEDPDSWSAVTITNGRKSVIILNSSHSGGRPASDLMHELAHVIIGHTPARVDVTEDGALILNTYDRQQEDEANWLAGSLLLPREALMWIRRQGLDPQAAARDYGVSMQMLQYRLNVTGVDQQLQRTRSWGRRRS